MPLKVTGNVYHIFFLNARYQAKVCCQAFVHTDMQCHQLIPNIGTNLDIKVCVAFNL